ncbi:hypothetical protein CEXT_276511 [Caerostris extrusa]|uniref:Uncharacterized protein n=1 Tax=Caerostris extrusa TaxID=172846 RepID=A0AAV4SQX2_CAEEX|nr:hypothetical protein CEXT_276511 [Caerostris extrusa]
MLFSSGGDNSRGGKGGQKHLLDLTFWSVCFALYRDYRTVIRFGNNSLYLRQLYPALKYPHTLYLAMGLRALSLFCVCMKHAIMSRMAELLILQLKLLRRVL